MHFGSFLGVRTFRKFSVKSCDFIFWAHFFVTVSVFRGADFWGEIDQKSIFELGLLQMCEKLQIRAHEIRPGAALLAKNGLIFRVFRGFWTAVLGGVRKLQYFVELFAHPKKGSFCKVRPGNRVFVQGTQKVPRKTCKKHMFKPTFFLCSPPHQRRTFLVTPQP